MRYLLLRTRTNRRRSYTIKLGLTEGYDSANTTHEPEEVIQAAARWSEERAIAGQPFLTGMFREETLAYA